MTAANPLARLRALRVLPLGTVPVAGGLVVSALTSYTFLIVAARTLGSERYSSLSALWALAFLAAGGLYFPIEQEVARELAARRARDEGGAPVVRVAGRLAMAFASAVSLVLLAAAPVVIDVLFDGESFLLFAMIVALFGYGLAHLARGALSGGGEFSRYGMSHVYEGIVRAATSVLLAVVGTRSPGLFGLVVAIAPFAAVLYARRSRPSDPRPGPEMQIAEFIRPVVLLLVASVVSALLLNVGPLAVKLLASDQEKDATGRFLNGVIVARVPLFFFSAVQAAVLPRFSTLAVTRKVNEFRSGVERLVALVVALGVVATLAAFALGPTAMRVVFGADYVLGRRDLALLAIASSLFMMTQALAQALIALHGHARAALAWLFGVIVFVVVTAVASGLYLRVELGLLMACAASSVAMAWFLAVALRSTFGIDPETEVLPVVGVEVVE